LPFPVRKGSFFVLDKNADLVKNNIIFKTDADKSIIIHYL